MSCCMNVPQFQQRTSPLRTSSLQPGHGTSSSGASTRSAGGNSTDAARFSSKTKWQFGHWAVSGKISDLHSGQARMLTVITHVHLVDSFGHELGDFDVEHEDRAGRNFSRPSLSPEAE